MKALSLFSLAFAILVSTIALPFSSPALASCGTKSHQMSMNTMSDMQDMGMSDDMPMCCKMGLDHKKMTGGEAKADALNGEGEPVMESMDEHGMSGMKNEKEGQAGKQPDTAVKDLVCSMTVDPKTAETSVYKGKTYYFCSKEDKALFEKSPEKYVKPEKKKEGSKGKKQQASSCCSM